MKFSFTLFSFIIMSFVGCQQKKLIITMQKLEEKELMIFFERKEYPKLQIDAKGNFRVNFDTTSIVYTSTRFSEIKNLRDVYCITEKNLCLSEDHEFERLGFKIIGFSHFNWDTSGKASYTNPSHSFLIEKIRIPGNGE